MAVRIWFHLEPTEAGRFVWWAESPDVHGVFASGDSLAETRITAERIVREVLAEQGATTVDFEYAILEDPPTESAFYPDDWGQLSKVAS